MTSEERMSEEWPAPEWTDDGHVAEPTMHAWLDGALAPSAAEGVAAHVASCAACGTLAAEVRGVIAGAARVVALLDGEGAPPLRAERGGGASSSVPPRAWYRRPAVLSLAATLLLVVGVRAVWEGGARPAAVASMAEAPAAANAAVTADAMVAARSQALTDTGAVAVPKATAPMASARMATAPMAAAPMATAPMASAASPAPSPVASPAPPSAARPMAAEQVAVMAVSADAVVTTCLLVETLAADGRPLPPRMQLAEGVEGDVRLAWLWDAPRPQEPDAFRLRRVRPDSLAGADARGQGVVVTLLRDGGGWRGTATATGAAGSAVRGFRLRSAAPAACDGR
ncbi:MAG: zf-HC2 domain-containing protein [Gemmatimonadetes bacterium]|nr:zf-HC2 domain-containing protein [Gemmatimonadota bacterium]